MIKLHDMFLGAGEYDIFSVLIKGYNDPDIRDIYRRLVIRKSIV